jgi:hypothetical protein
VAAQKIQYAKSKSNHVAKLDGTFKMAGGAAEVEVTSLQQRIFNAPTSGATAPAAGAPAAAKSAGDQTMRDTNSPDTRGQKRQRDEEEEDSDSDVAMEEDSDDD